MDSTQNPNMVPQKRGLVNNDGPATRSKQQRTSNNYASSSTVYDNLSTEHLNQDSTGLRSENSTAANNVGPIENSRSEFMTTEVFKEWIKSLERKEQREREDREERERTRREEKEIERIEEREKSRIRKEEQGKKRREEMKSYLGRQIKDFNGSPEVYVSWKHNVQTVLADSTLGSKDKLKCLSLKLVGEAMHMVPEANDFNTPEELFDFIEKALQKSSARLYAECKQRVSESVLNFSFRLKGIMKTLSQDCCSDKNCSKLQTTQLTHLFRTGLHTSIQKDLRTAYIQDYDELLRQALVYEDEIALHKMEKSKTNQLYHVDEKEQKGIVPTTEIYNIQNKGPQVPRRFFGECFVCHEDGHPYVRCPKATRADIEKIRANLPALINQARAKRDQSRNNSLPNTGIPNNIPLNANGPTTTPQ